MEQYLIILLLKIAVAASIASVGVRSDAARRMLLREERTLAQRVRLSLWFAAIFTPGVLVRIATGSYKALDLALEGALLAGITGGYVCGWFAGMMIAIPSMFVGEVLSLPFFAVVGLSGGLLRDAASDKEDIWRISPFPDARVRRILQHGVLKHQRDFRGLMFTAFFFFAVVATELLRQVLGTAFKERLFTIARWNDPPAKIIAVCASTWFCVTIPLKVWNNTRNEAKLETQERLLIQARLEALASQINPHFLFNTLNSVSSLIRVNPEQARVMVMRLSRIMRGRLRNQDHFAPLRDELAFIEDYLSIELVRFGDKLRVVKNIDPATLDMLVPSMLLQPLIENSIKHGISSKVDGGTVTIRTAQNHGRLSIEVEDDGVGIPETDLAGILNKGIGVSNVKERLKVLYDQDYRMLIDSQPGRGTRIEIEVPGLPGVPRRLWQRSPDEVTLVRRGPVFESSHPSDWVRWHADYLDVLLKSTILAFASMIPAMPGIIAALGAAAWDLSHRLWLGAILSGLSMIPLAGYLPGAGKIAWNLRLIGKELSAIEEMLPQFYTSPELIQPIQHVIHTYFDQISKINSSLPLIKRLRAILDVPAV